MTRRFICFCCIIMISTIGFSQSNNIKSPKENNLTSLPYKILTSGKRITVQCTQNINKLIAWSSAGTRIFEQKDINLNRYSFLAQSTDRIIFILLELQNGKRYTQKVGLNNNTN